MRLYILIMLSLLTFSIKARSYNYSKENIIPKEVLKLLRSDDINKSISPQGYDELGNIDSLWENYPSYDYTDEEVKLQIGGRVDASWIVNTCTIRLSHALNYSGFIIQRNEFSRFGKLYQDKGLTVSGRDGLWYAPRVAEMSLYLLKKYGKPLHFKKGEKITKRLKQRKGVYSRLNRRETKTIREKIESIELKGLIMFNVAIWDDATGHFDIIYNDDVKGHDRYLEAHEIFIWATAI